MALRTELRLRAPAASKRQKLKSVMDRIDHHKQQLHKIKKRLKEIEAERTSLEEQLADLEGGLGTLEQDKETLCTLVAAQGFEDSSSDTSPEPSEDGYKTPTPAQADAFLNKLDPVLVMQWAQGRLRKVAPGSQETEVYQIGGGDDEGMSGGGE